MEKAISDEQIKNEILDFVVNNTNEEGIDISKLYFARLIKANGSSSYNKYPINSQNNPNEVSIVFIRETYKGNQNNIYVDMFNKTILEDHCLIIPGVLSFAPMIKAGIVVYSKYRLDEVLEVQRLPFESLSVIYSKLKKINSDTVVKMSNEEFIDYCNNGENIPIISHKNK